MAARLNLKQLAFIRHYLGPDDTIAGNASACYRVAYQSKAKPKTINAMASKLMANTKIKAVIEAATKQAIEAVNWSARTVLEESVLLYNRCMGNEAVPEHYIATNRDTGVRTAHTVYRRTFNPQGARAALELIGRNTGIQAFQDNVEVSHTHYLEQALAARAKAVESRATNLVPVLPGPTDQADASCTLVEPGDHIQPGHPPGGSPAPGTAARPDPARPAPGGSHKEGPSRPIRDLDARP